MPYKVTKPRLPFVIISKEEAEKESAKILEEADQNLAKVRTNIESSFNKCVEIVLKSVFAGKA